MAWMCSRLGDVGRIGIQTLDEESFARPQRRGQLSIAAAEVHDQAPAHVARAQYPPGLLPLRGARLRSRQGASGQADYQPCANGRRAATYRLLDTHRVPPWKKSYRPDFWKGCVRTQPGLDTPNDYRYRCLH